MADDPPLRWATILCESLPPYTIAPSATNKTSITTRGPTVYDIAVPAKDQLQRVVHDPELDILPEKVLSMLRKLDDSDCPLPDMLTFS